MALNRRLEGENEAVREIKEKLENQLIKKEVDSYVERRKY